MSAFSGLARSDRFFDGAYLESVLPNGWTFSVDQSVRGTPFTYRGDDDACLQVWASTKTPDDPLTNYERAQALTEYAAESLRFRAKLEVAPPLISCRIGRLDGYVCCLVEESSATWTGFFVTDVERLLNLRFQAPISGFAVAFRDVATILNSLRIRRNE